MRTEARRTAIANIHPSFRQRTRPITAVAAVVAVACHWQALAGPVIGPMPSPLNVYENTCSHWRVGITYTATPLSDADMVLANQGYNWFSTDQHMHYVRGGTAANATLMDPFHSSSNAGMVSDINRVLFGTPTPAVGQQRTLSWTHDGGCANDIGMTECVGILIGRQQNMSWRPHQEVAVFPTSSRCFHVPPAAGSCNFDVPSKATELGVVGAEGAATDIPLTYSCSGSAPKYRVGMADGKSTMAVNPNVGSIALTVAGKTLPVGVDASSGAHQISLHAVFQPSSGKTGAFTAVGTIILDLQ